MSDRESAGRLPSMLRALDPRRSLAVGAMWLIIGLAVAFSIAATVWVGSIARENVLEQHVRRLALETDQLSSELGQALVARLDAIRAAGGILRATTVRDRPNGLSDVFNELLSAYPQLGWIAVADSHGAVVSANGALPAAGDVASSRWFTAGLHGPWLGVIAQS